MGIREFNKKINSLKNTRKITSSMKMISSVKLQKFTKLRMAVAPFWETTQSVMNRMGPLIDDSHILYKGYEKPQKDLIVLFSSDRGLCGRFNSNAIRVALQLSDKLFSNNRECQFSFVGAKGHAFFKRRKLQINKFYETSSYPDYKNVIKIAEDLFNDFMTGNFHEIWIVYSKKSGVVEEPCVERLLPFINSKNPPSKNQQVLLEENGSDLISKYGLLAIKSVIYKAILESSVSEHTARRSAMDSATSNCEQMIQRYIKLRNRARQTAITTELSEIVSGKEAIDN